MTPKHDKNKDALKITVSFKSKKEKEVNLYNDILKASEGMAVSHWMKMAAIEKLKKNEVLIENTNNSSQQITTNPPNTFVANNTDDDIIDSLDDLMG